MCMKPLRESDHLCKINTSKNVENNYWISCQEKIQSVSSVWIFNFGKVSTELSMRTPPPKKSQSEKKNEKKMEKISE